MSDESCETDSVAKQSCDNSSRHQNASIDGSTSPSSSPVAMTSSEKVEPVARTLDTEKTKVVEPVSLASNQESRSINNCESENHQETDCKTLQMPISNDSVTKVSVSPADDKDVIVENELINLASEPSSSQGINHEMDDANSDSQDGIITISSSSLSSSSGRTGSSGSNDVIEVNDAVTSTVTVPVPDGRDIDGPEQIDHTGSYKTTGCHSEPLSGRKRRYSGVGSDGVDECSLDGGQDSCITEKQLWQCPNDQNLNNGATDASRQGHTSPVVQSVQRGEAVQGAVEETSHHDDIVGNVAESVDDEHSGTCDPAVPVETVGSAVPPAGTDGELDAMPGEKNAELNVDNPKCSWAEFDFSVAPELLVDCREEFCRENDVAHKNINIDVSPVYEPRKMLKNNFLKGCKWAPDGSCLLTCSEDNALRVFTLPDEAYANQKYTPSKDSKLNRISVVAQRELIYDYCWFPNMTSYDPGSCLYVAACKDHPVHMWDACTGEHVCTYRAMNHLDLLISTHSLCFTSDAKSLICGHDKYIRVFDLARPKQLVYSVMSADRKLNRHPGIISSIATTPWWPDAFAAGSYCRTIGLYAMGCKSVQSTFTGHRGGITHMTFSPCGNYLFSGARMDSLLLCWDLRMPGHIVASFHRCVETNQRIYFEVDKRGNYLVSGNTDGRVTVWDLKNVTGGAGTDASFVDKLQDDGCKDKTDSKSNAIPIRCFRAHNAAVNGVSVNPLLGLMATSSGNREIAYPHLAGSDEDSDEAEDELGNLSEKRKQLFDNSLKLWWIGKYAK